MGHRKQQQAEAVFHDLVDQTPDEQNKFFEMACKGDIELRELAEKLLEPSDEVIDRFLQTPAFAPEHRNAVQLQAEHSEKIVWYYSMD